MKTEVTGTDAGLSGTMQIEIAVKAIFDSDGTLKMKDIYSAIEKVINQKNYTLSFQGRSSLRFFINSVAVKKGLIKKYDKENPGWRLTEKGKALAIGQRSIKNIKEYCLPTEESPGPLIEGAKQQILVNKYERNVEARNICIQHYGCKCQACGLSFEEKYGLIGVGFIHVHHIIPLHTISEEYKVDPIKDLIPLCPNCHSMIHFTDPILSVNELKEKIDALAQLSEL